MAKVTIKTETCKGCGLCIEACPKKIIELGKSAVNKKGHYFVGITDQSKCIACGFCFTMCPDCAITIEK